jgi:hypothetical protein
MLRALGEVVATKRPAVIASESGPEKGSLAAHLQGGLGGVAPPPVATTANRCPYPILQVPLLHNESVAGVFQVWLQPYVGRESYAEFGTFLTNLAAHVEQHLQGRRLGNVILENQRLQQMLRFTHDVAGSLESVQVARLAANYARDLIGCDRCAVLYKHGNKWKVLAISGQETVEQRSSMVRAIALFAGGHVDRATLPAPGPDDASTANGPEPIILSRQKLLAPPSTESEPEPQATIAAPQPVDPETTATFLELSRAASIAICPIANPQGKLDAALFAESSVDGFFEPGSGQRDNVGQRVGQWMAVHTGRALQGAMDYEELPMLKLLKPLRDGRRELRGNQRKRFLRRIAIAAALVFGTLLFPWTEEVEADCTLMPTRRATVVPELGGVVAKVHVREGSVVKEGDVLAELDSAPLVTQLEEANQEVLTYQAEAKRLSAAGDEGGAETARVRSGVPAARVKKLQRDIEATKIRATISGTVLSKDVELLKGTAIQTGTPFMQLAGLDEWQLLVHVNEKRIRRVEEQLSTPDARNKGVPVHFILYSQTAVPLTMHLRDRSQISQVAYTHERQGAARENAFVLTLKPIEADAAVKRHFRPELTGRASIPVGKSVLCVVWARNLMEWITVRWLW